MKNKQVKTVEKTEKNINQQVARKEKSHRIQQLTRNTRFKFSDQMLLNYKKAVNSNYTIGNKVRAHNK